LFIPAAADPLIENLPPGSHQGGIRCRPRRAKPASPGRS